MKIANTTSIKSIEKQYNTGEKPVLVVCADLNQYICKYMQTNATAYKLICELTGAWFASVWNIISPDTAFVHIKSEHCCGLQIKHGPAFGSRKLDTVIDITPSTSNTIKTSEKQLRQILKIALFDIWVSNEDRNMNNANLMYNISTEDLIAIDHGCIFNTATFDFRLALLTTNESILCSELAHNILSDASGKTIENIRKELKKDFHLYIKHCSENMADILKAIPKEWHIDCQTVEEKLKELFDTVWIKKCWNSFEEYLTDNIQ